jgi:DNA-binding HxlR family transcriptional regulator
MSSMKKNNLIKCSTTELKILGDFWTLEIIQELNNGEKRFSQLQRGLPTISPTTLANRLKKLKKQNLISSKKETLDKLSVVYLLTSKGQGIVPILKEIKHFAEKYL